ncbi:HET-domain-containing protein [Lizonia empirigonia]|nr:HET-domain-containing protein [Lizonia empirigonia]
MRLLKYDEHGEFSIINFDNSTVPPYAILSHMWGTDAEEVTYADLETGDGRSKRGYEKIRFCGQQAQRNGLQYFWVDTCCIDKTDKAELSHAIQSMFRWYQNATRCYVYLSDVSTRKRKADDMLSKSNWEPALRASRWFTRSWPLQELLAPRTVEFFSQDWERLGDKIWLKSLIHKITSIQCEVLDGAHLSRFSVNKRLRWKEGRVTQREEDGAYSLQGILDVELAPNGRDPRADKKRIEGTKGGLLPNSYHWVLDNGIFQQWQQDPHSRLLMVHDEDFKTSCLVVDALDECAVDLPQLLDLIVRTAASSSCVKWLVSSRNENHRAEAQNAEQVARAVDAYIDHKLSCLESLEEDAVVEEAPAGLPQLYNRMMDQIQRLSPRNADICRSLLCTAVIAYRPLYLAEMGSLRRLPGRATALAETVRKIIAMCGSFLTIRDEQVYLVHQLAKDYLSDKMHHYLFTYLGVIESYPLQTYASALLFSPTRSVTRRLFRHDEPNGIAIRPAMSAGWSACLQTLEGHSNGVSSVAFSHDSSKLASASWDNTVKVWDASSGACLQTLNIGRLLYSLSFDSTSSFLHSKIGPIAIHNPGTSSEVAVVAPERPLYLGTSLSPDSIWIKYDGKNVLWIPSEYRPSRSVWLYRCT